MAQSQRKHVGEGDREADRRYRESAEDFAKSGKVKKAASKAENQDPKEAQAAEAAGKAKAKGLDSRENQEFDRQSADGSFLTDIKTLRERARKKIEEGAVTEGYAADREVIIELLNNALATELVCILRYKRHYYMATGLKAQAAAAEFKEHAEEEQQHADMLAERITQLGGAPDFSPKGLQTRAHAEYVEGESLQDMLKEDLIAERIAIDSYGELIRFIGDDDPTTRRMLEEILATEEEHADDLSGLMA
jgi:bacterioferritin